ncbi:hypothetical protein [Streptomyces uncialis]|uniref:hypothetical protein n=1 Tax=Streptomyces uncialis TaxID=1048205 RepID=UPI0033CE122A
MSVDPLTTEYHTVDRFQEIRSVILDVYAEVYAQDIATDPFFSLERFEERLEMHTSAPGWGCASRGSAANTPGSFTASRHGTARPSASARTCSAPTTGGVASLR